MMNSKSFLGYFTLFPIWNGSILPVTALIMRLPPSLKLETNQSGCENLVGWSCAARSSFNAAQKAQSLCVVSFIAFIFEILDLSFNNLRGLSASDLNLRLPKTIVDVCIAPVLCSQ
jgi:hypothetical protein